MAMCRQTVQRYGGFPIPAIVVRDAGEAFPVVTRDSPSLLHGQLHERYMFTRTVTRTLYVYTDFVTTKNGISDRHARKIYFSPEENIFSSGGKKLHPPVDDCPVTRVTRLHEGMFAFVYFPPEMSTSFYKYNK